MLLPLLTLVVVTQAPATVVVFSAPVTSADAHAVSQRVIRALKGNGVAAVVAPNGADGQPALESPAQCIRNRACLDRVGRALDTRSVVLVEADALGSDLAVRIEGHIIDVVRSSLRAEAAFVVPVGTTDFDAEAIPFATKLKAELATLPRSQAEALPAAATPNAGLARADDGSGVPAGTWVAGGAAVAAAGVGVGFGLASKSTTQARDRAVTVPEFTSLDDRARQQALVSNVAYGTAAAAAITATVIYLFARD